MIMSKESYTLDQYIRHEQYKFIYTHPVYLKHGQRSGFFLACVNKEDKDQLKYSIVALTIMWFFLLCSFIVVPQGEITLPIMSGMICFFSAFSLLLCVKDFIFTRKSLWVKLEKEFMKEKVSDLQMDKMSQALTSYQKSVFWMMLGMHKKNIDFNDIVKVVKETNDHVNREKLIDILRK